MEVAEGDVADVALAGVRLDPANVARVGGLDVIENDVLNIVRLVGVGADAADSHDAGLVAGHIADMDVGAVALDADAVLGRSVQDAEPRGNSRA